MHVSLTDLLTCPRCGPAHGLVLLPGEVRERRVWTGVLGCPNCRERYPVEAGVGRLSPAGSVSWADPVVEPRSDREAAIRLAALLGLAEGGGVVLVAGPAVAQARELAEVAPEVEVVVMGEGAVPGVSGLSPSNRIPFRTGVVRGVALGGGSVPALVEEAARVLRPGGRLVLEPVEGMEELDARVEAAGLRVVARQGSTLVAEG